MLGEIQLCLFLCVLSRLAFEPPGQSSVTESEIIGPAHCKPFYIMASYRKKKKKLYHKFLDQGTI